MQKYTTIKTGGRARYLIFVHTKEQLRLLLDYCKKNKKRFFVLGAGSKCVFISANIVVRLSGEFGEITYYDNLVTAGAAVYVGRLVATSLLYGLGGTEFLSGIPATVGGAIVQNAGCYGSQISDIVKSVIAIDKMGNIKTFNSGECEFSYRTSFFKKSGEWIVLAATFDLPKANKQESMQKISELTKKRASAQPKGASVGSTFCKLNSELSAGQLIDKCGLKGLQYGKMKISEQHANFIINLGGGSAKDFVKLANKCKKQVKKQFGVRLVEEAIYIKKDKLK